MNVELRKASFEERSIVQKMMELYLHDFSEFDGCDLDQYGLYSYYDLDYYFIEETHACYVVQVEGKWAGLALIANYGHFEGNQRSMEEFFILRKYRKQGLGEKIASDIFRLHPARWEVEVQACNPLAQQFWRKTIGNFTGGAMREVMLNNEKWHGPVFCFDNSVAEEKHEQQ